MKLWDNRSRCEKYKLTKNTKKNMSMLKRNQQGEKCILQERTRKWNKSYLKQCDEIIIATAAVIGFRAKFHF